MASASDEYRRQTRPGRHLRIRELNVEKGATRFNVANDLFPPETAAWRNNLIALSQRRNLLFAAYRHKIYVWEPAGSSQTLGAQPEMIIIPVMKNLHAEGYISPRFPHAINNILVDDLGREEVLLLATDSGNVCGYRVEAIFSALERAAESGQARPLDGSEVHPFFVEFVGNSAWGLAIHKFARLIAVSANTGLITVFAFALVGDPTPEDSSDSSGRSIEAGDDLREDGLTWETVNTSEQFMQLRNLMPDRHRSRNIRLTYTGHFTNIPSVSFLNCDLDPNGTWMMSTDIDNKMLVWKIWQSLGPFNVYHFNDITTRAFPGTLRNDERGWSVLALDPRTFYPCRSVEEACGGDPRHLAKNGRKVLDLSMLTNKIPNRSRFYNFFPSEVRPEPEPAILPDIFGPDCRISGQDTTPSFERETRIAHGTFTGHRSDAGDIPQILEEATGNVTAGSDNTHIAPSTHMGNPEGLDVQMEGQNSDDGDVDMDAIEAGGLGENSPIPSSEDSEQDNGSGESWDVQSAPFIHLALLDALGGGPLALNEYFGNAMDYSDEGDIDDDNDDSPNEDEDVHEDDEGEDDEEDEEMDDIDEDAAHAGRLSVRMTAYQVFDRMLRKAFPDDPDPYGRTERLMDMPPTPATCRSDFPILHFSETDIRLMSHPFATHAAVVCGAPLRQPFTHLVTSIHSYDRFNMVKYVPEHGIVVAASQKGRTGIIALTRYEDCMLFRIDWIIPFKSQEKYGDRPLKPLLGMSVSPIQGFEMPPDVPYIPRDAADLDNLDFRFKAINSENDDDDDGNSSMSNQDNRGQNSSDADKSHISKISDDGVRSWNPTTLDDDPTETSNVRTDSESGSESPQLRLTLPECHAEAFRVYRPDESWRGWHPSRRYRLLLMYDDHTVMSYEFWYDQSQGSGKGDDDESDDSGYLVI